MGSSAADSRREEDAPAAARSGQLPQPASRGQAGAAPSRPGPAPARAPRPGLRAQNSASSSATKSVCPCDSSAATSALWHDVTGAPTNDLKRDRRRRESDGRSSQWPRGGGGPRRECESEHQYAWGVEDCAGGAGRRWGDGGRRAGERRGRSLPLPGSGLVPRAARLSAPGREMWPPLGLLAGNARGGPCRAERGRVPRGERSWVRSGRGVLPRCRRAPSPAVRPGPGGCAAGGVGSGTRAVAGARVTGDAGPVAMRPGVSSTRDKGRGVEGARSACPRPCARIAAPARSSSVALRRPRVHGRLWRVPGAATGPRGPAPPRAWPPAGRSAGGGWAQAGRSAACSGLKAAPLQRRECQPLGAGCRAERRALGRGARDHRAATSLRGLGVWGSRAGGVTAVSPPANSAGLLVLLML